MEAQPQADTNNKKLYDALNDLYDPKTRGEALSCMSLISLLIDRLRFFMNSIVQNNKVRSCGPMERIRHRYNPDPRDLLLLPLFESMHADG